MASRGCRPSARRWFDTRAGEGNSAPGSTACTRHEGLVQRRTQARADRPDSRAGRGDGGRARVWLRS